MKIKLICKCGSELTLNPEWIGKEVLCFDCGEMVRVPSTEENVVDAVVLEDDAEELELVEEALELEVLKDDDALELQEFAATAQETPSEDIPEVDVQVEQA